MPEPAEIDPVDLRMVSAQLHDAAETAAGKFAEHHSAMEKAISGSVGPKSKKALEEALAHFVEQDRLIVASMRDIAHHMPSSASAYTSTDD